MIIKFYNDLGSVTFAGGGRELPFRLTAVEGLGLSGKTFNSESYVGSPGQKTTGVSVNARTITLSGDLPVSDDIQWKLSKTLVILNQEGTLEFNVGYISRKIQCRCSAADISGRDTARQNFVFQFLCDNPYFEDLENTYIAVFDIIPLLDNTFEFPGVFSKRISRGNINILGSAEVEPIFYIDVAEVSDETSGSGITIKNYTTGQFIRLDYTPSAGEYITIDIPNRRIYNSDGTDLLEYIAEDTFLNGMTLIPGDNDIEVLNYSTNTNMTVICEFTNKYVEAVW